MKKINSVLILDDDDAVRESLEYHFEDQGWITYSAASGEEALKVLANNTLDFVIVDIRLPGINGNQFIEQASNIYKNIFFLICTGSPDYAPPEKLLNHQRVASKVFTKPVSDLTALEEALIKMKN